MVLVDVGQACEVGPAAIHYCKDSSSVNLCSNGLCVARPGVGDACSTEGACDATTGACVDGTCADAGGDGDSCDNGFNCKLGFACRTGKCTALTEAETPPTCK
jgi:hypothetical protein